jgi:hypothetical protein
MNEMRLGRSFELTLPSCEGLLPLDLGEDVEGWTRDSSAGWAGSSLMCSGSRRTRLPIGAMVDADVGSNCGLEDKIRTRWNAFDASRARKTIIDIQLNTKCCEWMVVNV